MRVMLWLLATPDVSGLFNVGTGKARSFKDMMLAAYAALGRQSQYPICRYAGIDSRQLSILHARRCRSVAARRL